VEFYILIITLLCTRLRKNLPINTTYGKGISLAYYMLEVTEDLLFLNTVYTSTCTH